MSKIKRLVIKNCLGIQELAINTGQVNVISGGNERGKTSILETIEKALYNTERRARFIRSGADQAYIELETDDGMKVERFIQKDDNGKDASNVKVTLGGIPQKAPESFLKELFGFTPGKKKSDVFAFNPVDFMNKKDTEQTDILLSLLPIYVAPEDAENWFNGTLPSGIDWRKHGLQVLKDLEKYWYEARREANSLVKATKAESESVEKRLPDNYQLEKWEEVSLGSLYNELRDAEAINTSRSRAEEFLLKQSEFEDAINNKYNLQIKDKQEFKEFKLAKERQGIEQRKQAVQLQIEEVTQQIIELEKKRDRLYMERDNLLTMSLADKEEALDREMQASIKGIEENRQRELNDLARKADEAQNYLADNPQIDIEPLQHRCKHTEEMKQFIPLAKELQGIRERLQDQEKTAWTYNLYVELCRNKPAELLAEVELPLDGLGIDESGNVIINGLPLRNLSTSRQVRVCLDIARAHARNNPLKLICVDKLEHMDLSVRNEFLKQIEEDTEFQYFVTLVTDGDLKIETKGA